MILAIFQEIGMMIVWRERLIRSVIKNLSASSSFFIIIAEMPSGPMDFVFFIDEIARSTSSGEKVG